jgi:superfamily I DNA/RNA helicase
MKRIRNLDVFTYHGYCAKNYYPGGSHGLIDDNKLIRVTNDPTKKARAEYDIIILDEAQDLTPQLVEFVKVKIIPFCLGDQMCILGDQMQNLYAYLGSSNRYIKKPWDHFKLRKTDEDGNEREWKSADLFTSYRVPMEIANFVNAMVGYQKIISTKAGSKVQYLICDPFANEGMKSALFQEYLRYTEMGFKPEDFFFPCSFCQQSLVSSQSFCKFIIYSWRTYFRCNRR